MGVAYRPVEFSGHGDEFLGVVSTPSQTCDKMGLLHIVLTPAFLISSHTSSGGQVSIFIPFPSPAEQRELS